MSRQPITEGDILAEMKAARPPEREAGWYTRNELALALGRSFGSVERQIKMGVETGKYESKRMLVQDSAGRNTEATVYRLKASN